MLGRNTAKGDNLARASFKVLQDHLSESYGEDIMSSKKGLVTTNPFLLAATFISYSLATKRL